MSYASKYSLQPADRIVESITPLGISKHHAIYLGNGRDGIEWIAENYKFQGVRLIRANDYFRTVLRINRIERFAGTARGRKLAVQRALDLIGKPYSLINFNCEHFAEYVQHGKSKSSQADNAAVGLLAFLFIKLISD